MGNITSIEKKLNNNNEKLAQILANQFIKKLYLTSLGNSIGTGYSLCRITKPLLLRNETLKTIMNKKGIESKLFSFARSQNNNDNNMFNWIISNITQIDFNKMNISDFSNGPTSMPTTNIGSDELIKYYPTKNIENLGLKDIIFSSAEDMSNIVIYNGCTGSFLDNVGRCGQHKFTYGIKRDITSLESTLKLIQQNNREKNSNTQVYLCGAPNFLGLRITEVINYKLKKLEKKYSMVTYVEPVVSKFFYKNINTSKFGIDIHYDELEYLKLNNNIIEAIINNYNINQALIDIDRVFLHLSSNIELNNSNLINNKNEIFDIICGEVEKEFIKLNDEVEQIKFIKKLKKYILEIFPYDFYYLNKDNVKKMIKKIEI